MAGQSRATWETEVATGPIKVAGKPLLLPEADEQDEGEDKEEEERSAASWF
jgi:hypothetical protein